MLLKDAVAAYVNKVEIEEARRAQARLEAEAAAEAKRQEFGFRLRERIEMQYGLELTGDDMAEWVIDARSGGYYEMTWKQSKGGLAPTGTLTTAQVTPGPDSLDFKWRAWHCGSGDTFDSLVPALVYAKTGKQL